MKRIQRKILIFLFFIVFMQCGSFADQSAGVFLELPASARAGGMADCYTALSNGPFGAYYNPAGISFVKLPTASFQYQSYLQDISGNYVSITIPTKYISFNLAPALAGMKEEPVYDSAGNDTGRRFKYQGTIIPFSAACKIKNLSLGATAKYYKEEIGSYSKDVTTYDAGIIYKSKKLSLGFSGLNLSGKLGEYDLPETFRYGAAYSNKNFNLLLDYISQARIQKDHYNVGGEMLISDTVFLRLGYKLKDDFGGLSCGLGLKLGNFDIDYALSSYSDLGYTQRASVSCYFSWPKSEKEKRKSIEQLEKQEEVIAPSEPLNSLCPNVAVSELEGMDMSSADISMVTDFIRTELARRKYFNVLRRIDMNAKLAEQKFQPGGCASEECAIKMGKILNVQGVLVGVLSEIYGAYHINVSLVDVRTGKVLRSIDQKARTINELKDACDQLVDKLIK